MFKFLLWTLINYPFNNRSVVCQSLHPGFPFLPWMWRLGMETWEPEPCRAPQGSLCRENLPVKEAARKCRQRQWAPKQGPSISASERYRLLTLLSTWHSKPTNPHLEPGSCSQARLQIKYYRSGTILQGNSEHLKVYSASWPLRTSGTHWWGGIQHCVYLSSSQDAPGRTNIKPHTEPRISSNTFWC